MSECDRIVIIAVRRFEVTTQFLRQIDPEVILILGVTDRSKVEVNFFTTLRIDPATIRITQGGRTSLAWKPLLKTGATSKNYSFQQPFTKSWQTTASRMQIGRCVAVSQLNVVIESEFVWMWPQPNCVHFLCAFVVNIRT
jgi:hypothetical protein